MVIRLVDFLKMNGITLVMTALVDASTSSETTTVNISSVVDTWIALRNTEHDGEIARTLSVVKARGMNHSNQRHEFVIGDEGIEIKGARMSRMRQ
jgi:circadian clock protein KaiC